VTRFGGLTFGNQDRPASSLDSRLCGPASRRVC